MKKIAILLAVLMVFGAIPGFAISETVDTFIENRMDSDIRVVEDTGKILDMTNQGVDKTYHMVTDPMEPVLDPVRHVRDEGVHGTKSLLNVIWDTVTLHDLRHKE